MHGATNDGHPAPITRCRFGSTLCEIRTSCERGRAIARVYIVQEWSLALQPYEPAELFYADSKQEAHARAVCALTRGLGLPTSLLAPVADAGEYRILEGPRTA